MRRVVLRWVAAIAVIALAAAGSVALVVTLGFGPGAFVTSYLDALGRRDAASALALPGVAPGDGDRALLTGAALPGLTDIRIVGDVAHDRGVHRVTAAWRSNGTPGETAFEVARVGTRFGVFPIWAFVHSPVAQLALEVRNSREVTAEDLAVRTPAVGANVYTVLVPGDYRFVHRDALLSSAEEAVVVDAVGQRFSATVDVEATPRFVDAAAARVHALLRQCTTQQVLFPAGCPFGQEIDDRVTSAPVWSIAREPVIRLVGAGDDANWMIPTSPGTAHLSVRVQSLYDGTTSTVDKDVPFTIRADVRVDAAGGITLSDVR